MSKDTNKANEKPKSERKNLKKKEEQTSGRNRPNHQQNAQCSREKARTELPNLHHASSASRSCLNIPNHPINLTCNTHHSNNSQWKNFISNETKMVKNKAFYFYSGGSIIYNKKVSETSTHTMAPSAMHTGVPQMGNSPVAHFQPYSDNTFDQPENPFHGNLSVPHQEISTATVQSGVNCATETWAASEHISVSEHRPYKRTRNSTPPLQHKQYPSLELSTNEQESKRPQSSRPNVPELPCLDNVSLFSVENSAHSSCSQKSHELVQSVRPRSAASGHKSGKQMLTVEEQSSQPQPLHAQCDRDNPTELPPLGNYRLFNEQKLTASYEEQRGRASEIPPGPDQSSVQKRRAGTRKQTSAACHEPSRNMPTLIPSRSDLTSPLPAHLNQDNVTLFFQGSSTTDCDLQHCGGTGRCAVQGCRKSKKKQDFEHSGLNQVPPLSVSSPYSFQTDRTNLSDLSRGGNFLLAHQQNLTTTAQPLQYHVSEPCAANELRLANGSGVRKKQLAQTCQRETATARERHRVRTVNEAFELLKQKTTGESDKRMSKLTILRNAIRYIANMDNLLKETNPMPTNGTDGTDSSNTTLARNFSRCQTQPLESSVVNSQFFSTVPQKTSNASSTLGHLAGPSLLDSSNTSSTSGQLVETSLQKLCITPSTSGTVNASSERETSDQDQLSRLIYSLDPQNEFFNQM